jgi:hypothetical protein
VPVRHGSGNPEGLNLTRWKSRGKLEKTATPDGNESSPMVCVRFLRTQQRAKSQCIYMYKTPVAGWFFGVVSHGLAMT